MKTQPKRNVLIVDDVPEEIEQLKNELEKTGYVVAVTTTGDNIDASLAKYSAVILDQDLGPSSRRGSEVAKDILRIMPDYPVFGFVRQAVGPSPHSSVSELYDAGCRGVWIKGFDPEEFILRLGLSLYSEKTYDAVINFLEMRSPDELLDACQGAKEKSALVRAVWGSGTERLRSNIASNLASQAEALLGKKQTGAKKEAYELLIKAFIVDSHSEPAMFVLVRGHRSRTFSGAIPDTNDFANFIRLAGEAAGVIDLRRFTALAETMQKTAQHSDPVRGERDALVCVFADELGHVDYTAWLNIQQARGKGRRTQRYIGRVHHPRLALPVKQLSVLSSREYSVLDDLVKKGKSNRVICHRGTIVHAAAGVFGPAIDTLWFNEMLHKTLYRETALRPKCVCDLGCGSGFLLCSLIHRYADSLEHVLAIDSSMDALILTEENIQRAIQESSASTAYSLIKSETGLSALNDTSIDILVMNPPYLPTKEDIVAEGESAVFGWKLINDVACGHGTKVMSPGGKAFILRSSLTPDQDIWSDLPPNCWKEPRMFPDSLRVPLDLLEVAGDPKWESVNREKGGLVVNPSHPHYQHWHDLAIVELTKLTL